MHCSVITPYLMRINPLHTAEEQLVSKADGTNFSKEKDKEKAKEEPK